MDEEDARKLVELIAIRDRVVRHEITTVEAEREAAARGLPPFVSYITEPSNVLISQSWWPLSLGIIWITRREMEDVTQRWASFKIWKRDLWADDFLEDKHERLHDAEFGLWRALEAGAVSSTGIDSVNGERVRIDPLQWLELRWLQYDLRQEVQHSSSKRIFKSVKVSRLEIQSWWPPLDQAASNPVGSASPVDKLTIAPPARRISGGPKIRSVIKALEKMYEQKPMSKNRVYLLAKLREELGYQVSGSTLDRAWGEAWK